MRTQAQQKRRPVTTRRVAEGSLVTFLVMAGLLVIVPGVWGRSLRATSLDSATSAAGTLVVVADDRLEEPHAGDVVVVATVTGAITSARVVGVDAGVPQLDSYDVTDPPVAVLGRVVFQVPMAGHVLSFLTTPVGMVAVMLMVITFFVSLWVLEDSRRLLLQSEGLDTPPGGNTSTRRNIGLRA